MSTIRVLENLPEPHPTRPRPGVRRLLQADGGNLICFHFLPGQSLPDHRAAHPITVQCLRGTLVFTCEDEEITMEPGVVLHLPAYLIHRVDCPADADPAEQHVLLLTMLTGEDATPPRARRLRHP
ncbi:cupin domain-containing protein [Corynebacterium uropygiale]|uniref:Cupin domain-containing protein n=1 Tax=Corynebacterium uropygiale TaxID=1775911 RepID=A0A9X1QR15_9CORY|nr:cupin domain-containing protein [Corynebacterium uropygiale]MCF4007734.1 cupin domain-containing protein [Corynebacterium uropygiale]